MSEIRLPLVISLAAHAACLALLLLLLPERTPAVPEAIAKGGIEVVFQPAPPKLETAPIPEPPQPVAPPPPEPQPEVEPPPPEPPAVAAEPAPPQPEAPVAAVEAPPEAPPSPRRPPPPPRKAAAKKPPKPAHRRQEPPQPTRRRSRPLPLRFPRPRRLRRRLHRRRPWLPRRCLRPKRPPDTARSSAVGSKPTNAIPTPRVSAARKGAPCCASRSTAAGESLDYAVISSSGYPDLDQSIEDMMRGATLPPFPAGMPQPRMEVSVTIRFSLRR